MTAKVLSMPNTLCRNCGHPKLEHTPTCQDGGGCGHSCPCKRFVPVSKPK